MTDIDTFIDRVSAAVINPIVTLLFAVGFLVFLWGIFQFVYSADDESKRSDGKRHILWGIVGMVIMVAAVGIVKILQATVDSL